ncbi:MAG: MFS transporter [Planctomycetes bacterium]|nr:MFS transporter [Planctomycetota bacterium]
MASIKEHQEKEKGKKASLKELFTRRMSFIIFIALGLGFFQQITGINAIFFYAPTIFEKTGIPQENAFLQTIIIGLVNLGFTILAIYIIDRFGRKPLLLVGTFMMSICLLINSWAFHSATFVISQETIESVETKVSAECATELKTILGQSYQNEDELIHAIDKFQSSEEIKDNMGVIKNKALNISAMLVLLAIIGYIAAFAISLGPVMWAMFSEIFPNRLRGLAISLAGFFNSLVSYAVQQVFPWELSTLGPAITFMIFGIFAMLAFFFTWRFIPETKGKSLEELEEILIKSN